MWFINQGMRHKMTLSLFTRLLEREQTSAHETNDRARKKRRDTIKREWTREKAQLETTGSERKNDR